MTPLLRVDLACLQPVPWSSPQLYMKTTKAGKRYKSAARNPEMERWQAYVKIHAEEAMAGRPPALGPLFASITFFRRTDNPELSGKVWFNGVEWSESKDAYVKKGETVPDVDNLAKSTLDAMQGIAFGNDVQVCALCVSRLYAAHDGAKIIINVLEAGDDI